MVAEQTEGKMFAKHFNYRMEQAKEQLPPTRTGAEREEEWEMKRYGTK